MLVIILSLTLLACLFLGFPVAWTLSGVSLLFAWLGIYLEVINVNWLYALPSRVYAIMNNYTLLAVPLFILMGNFLSKSNIAQDLLINLSKILARFPGSLAFSVTLIGTLLAASTGIVGASVIMLSMIALPVMLKHKYDHAFSSGTICAVGTLGQIIPPSIVLVILGDIMSNAYSRARGINPKLMNELKFDVVTVGDLFMGAIIPGLLLVLLYFLYQLFISYKYPKKCPVINYDDVESNNDNILLNIALKILPTIILIILVLGSIFFGFATATEASALGALGAFIIALFYNNFNLKKIKILDCLLDTGKNTSMIFAILIGASIFSLIFRAFGGDDMVIELLHNLPGKQISALLLVMFVIFLLGFVLDFIEISFVVVPLVAPALILLGIDPILIGVLIGLNLQTSFLTPPFGVTLFYMRNVAPKELKTISIYKGIIPYVIIQIIVIILVLLFPPLSNYLPSLT